MRKYRLINLHTAHLLVLSRNLLIIEKKMIVKKETLWSSTYSASDNFHLKGIYKKWAVEYDEDVKNMGYVAPYLAARYLLKWQRDRESMILDIGCGTGLVGEYLNELGYRNIHGLDLSPEMLSHAKSKGVYKDLFCTNLDFVTDDFNGKCKSCICIGMFTEGHVKSDGLDKMIPLIEPGGYLCFTVQKRAYEKYDFGIKIDHLSCKGAWKVLEKTEIDYLIFEEVKANLFICLIS